ncbi:MAG: hypothetical protein ABJP48_09720 [Erythrobacter sp.]
MGRKLFSHPSRIHRIYRIVPDVGVEVVLVFVPDGISLEDGGDAIIRGMIASDDTQRW